MLQNSINICRLSVSDPLELAGELRLEVWSHVVGPVPQTDLEIFVAKDLLFIAKDGVGELRIECRDVLEASRRRRDETDVNSIVGVGEPWVRIQSMLGFQR